jgi:hypothetical protein
MAFDSEKNVPFSSSRKLLHSMPIIPQEDFPSVDLLETNADLFKAMLTKDAGVDAQGRFYGDNQRQLHLIAHKALRLLKIPVEYTEMEFGSFKEGFAALELITASVRAKPQIDSKAVIAPAYDKVTAARRGREVLVSDPTSSTYSGVNQIVVRPDGSFTTSEDMYKIEETARQQGSPTAVFDLAAMYETWADTLPNTYAVIYDTTPPRRAASTQVFARIMGARVASQLQLVA